MDTKYNQLLSLRRSANEYETHCSKYGETPRRRERWMLHYDIIVYLVDNEYIDEDSFQLRFLNLEALAPQEAIHQQNQIRARMSLEPIYSAGDIIDLKTGTIIEVKVTFVPDYGTTQYLAESRKICEESGKILVIADTNSCGVIQPYSIFTKGVPDVVKALAERKEKMEQLNLSDNDISVCSIDLKLPSYLLEQEAKMDIKEDDFFLPNQRKIETVREQISQCVNMKLGYQEQLANLYQEFPRVTVPTPTIRRITKGTIKYKMSVRDNFVQISQFPTNRFSSLMTRYPSLSTKLRKIQNLRGMSLHMDYEIELKTMEKEILKSATFNRKFPVVTRPLEMGQELYNRQRIRSIVNKNRTENGTCKWVSPILPICQLKGFRSYSNEEMFERLKFNGPIHFSKDGEENWEGFQKLWEETRRDWKNILQLKNDLKALSDKKNKPILDLFGVGWKQIREQIDDEDDPMKRNTELKWQKRKDNIPPINGFPFWFEEIKEKLKRKLDAIVMPTLGITETLSKHKLDREACVAVDECVRYLQNRAVFHNISFAENFYNQLGGVFPSETKNKKKFQIFLGRLESLGYEDKDWDSEVDLIRKKSFWGFFWRGPDHTTGPTDNVNMFLCYFFSSFNDKIAEMHPNFTFGECVFDGETEKDTQNFYYGIRRIAVKKIIPSYLFCTTNCMYEPINTMGNTIMESIAILNENVFRKKNGNSEKKATLESLRDRIIESFIITLNTRNFDEGLYPYIRYEFLNALTIQNKCDTFVINQSEYEEKLKKELRSAGIAKQLMWEIVNLDVES